MGQLEFVPDQRPDVLRWLKGLQELKEVQQLPVVGVIVPARDGNAIVHLVPEGLRGVVNNDGFRQVPLEDRQLLEVVPLHQQACFPKEPVATRKEKGKLTMHLRRERKKEEGRTLTGSSVFQCQSNSGGSQRRPAERQ